MALKLIWSPSAKLDLKDIAAFIAEDSTSAAERFVTSLFQVVERLADFHLFSPPLSFLLSLDGRGWVRVVTPPFSKGRWGGISPSSFHSSFRRIPPVSCPLSSGS